MHRKNEGLFLKGKDKETDLVDEVDPMKENHNKATSSSEVCGMSYLSVHSIGNFSVHKANHMKFVTAAEGKDKERDQVLPKISRREVFFGAVKRKMAAWEKSSSDSNDSENTDNGFMAKSDEEDSDEKVTLCYFKQNLNTFSTSKLGKLDVVLFDLISEMTDEKGKIVLVAQVSDIESQMVVLETENLELKEKIKGATTTIFKIKRVRLSNCS